MIWKRNKQVRKKIDNEKRNKKNIFEILNFEKKKKNWKIVERTVKKRQIINSCYFNKMLKGNQNKQ